MGRTSRSLVQKMLRAADSDLFELPRAWHVFSRYRTAELFLKHPAPPAVVTNDAVFYQQLSKQVPQVKLQPMRINAIQPSLSKQFVQQQVAILKQTAAEHQEHQEQQQHPNNLDQLQQLTQQNTRALRRQAFNNVRDTLGPVLEKAGHESAAGGYLEYIQEQEEEALQAALSKLQEQQAAATVSSGS